MYSLIDNNSYMIIKKFIMRYISSTLLVALHTVFCNKKSLHISIIIKVFKSFLKTHVSLIPSRDTAVHSITLEQHEQLKHPLLSPSEFSLLQVDIHVLPILLLVEICVSSED